MFMHPLDFDLHFARNLCFVVCFCTLAHRKGATNGFNCCVHFKCPQILGYYIEEVGPNFPSLGCELDLVTHFY